MRLGEGSSGRRRLCCGFWVYARWEDIGGGGKLAIANSGGYGYGTWAEAMAVLLWFGVLRQRWGQGGFFFKFFLAWFWFLLILTLGETKGLDGIMSEGWWWYKDSNTPPKFTLKVSCWGSVVTFCPGLIFLRYNLCLPLFNFTLLIWSQTTYIRY